MADMRRHDPEPPPGMPQIQFTPGLADQMLRELAPLLAEECIDIDNIDAPDLDTLQRALNRAVERRDMELLAPSAPPETTLLPRCGWSWRPSSTMTAPSSTKFGLSCRTTRWPQSPAASPWGLLDDWLSGQARKAPASLGQHTTLPTGHWNGERAATDILVLARKGRAFRALDKLLTRQGGPQVLAGSALASPPPPTRGHSTATHHEPI